MLADEHLEPCPEAAREQHGRQGKERRKQERHLQRPAPAATKEAHPIAGARDNQKVDTRDQQRGRMEHDATGDVEIDRPGGVAHRRESDEGNRQRVRDPARRPERLIEVPEEQRVRKEKEIEREHSGKPDHDRLDCPAPLLGCASVELLN